MAVEYRSADAADYKMSYKEPHRELEPPQVEIAMVDEALAVLVEQGVLPHATYDHERFLAHRRAVAENFEIPWTAITPRMQRLLYAINAIRRPKVLLAAGVFCGNTFISNAGAMLGPGAVYQADRVIGVEIVEEKAQLAARNVRQVDPADQAEILAEDAVEVAARMVEPVDVLYLDADGDKERGKGIYLDILSACYDRMEPSAIVLAHNSVNCAQRLQHYLEFVRDPANFAASVNVVFDLEGLEVSVR